MASSGLETRNVAATNNELRIVAYELAHQEGIIAAVQDVYREYGWTWEAHGYHRDLYEIEATYLDRGGVFWVLIDSGRVVGCVGVTLHESNCELHRLYLLADYRGRGWGRKMLDVAMAYCRQRGCRRMIAWSDVVLREAHALYLTNGFVQEGQRICADPDKSREYGFWKEPL
jgi:putative acetyltransferase